MRTHPLAVLASLLRLSRTTAGSGRVRRPAAAGRPDPAAAGRVALLSGAAFLVGLTAVFFPLTDRRPGLRDAEYGTRFKLLARQLRDRPPGQSCVVMLGSSLTAMGFNPMALTTVKPAAEGGPVVFNFGMPNCRGVAHLMTLRRLLAAGVRPDLVLVDTQGSFCAGTNKFGDENYLPVLRLQGGDLPVVCRYDPDADAVCGRWLRLQPLPWHSYRKSLQAWWLPHWATTPEQSGMLWRFVDGNGWLVVPHLLEGARGWSHEQRSASPRYWAVGLSSEPCAEELVRAHHEIVAVCHRAGVRVGFVRMPEYSVLRAELKPQTRAGLDQLHAGLGRAAGWPVIDAREWIADDDFFDGTHLSPLGSVRFTRRLEEEALGPLLSQLAHSRVDP